MAAAARFSTTGEKEGGEGAEGRGGALYPPWGPGSEEEAGDATAAMAPVFPLSPQEEEGRERLAGGPTCQDSILFSFSRNSSRVLVIISGP